MAPSNLFSFYSDILQNNLFPSLTHVCFCYDEYNDPMIQYTHRVFFFILDEHLWSAVAWHKPCFRCDIRITIKQKTRKYKWASRVCVMNYGTIFFSPPARHTQHTHSVWHNTWTRCGHEWGCLLWSPQMTCTYVQEYNNNKKKQKKSIQQLMTESTAGVNASDQIY